MLPGIGAEELKARIADYDGLAVRSATKVTAELLAAAPELKIIGRAGIGVDNIDVAAATQRGIVVMNTPYGNSITAAEHAIAMLFALCRQIPAADRSTQAGKWEKSRFMGVELTGKTLGVIGCGNVGAMRRRARAGAAHEGGRLRSVPVGRARDRSRRRKGGARRAAVRAPISSPCTRR